jgi:hypothetical protein
MFRCECGREYKHRQSLHSHRKICNFINYEESTIKNCEESTIKNYEESNIKNYEEENDNLDYKEMFVVMMKQNQDLQQTILDQQRKSDEQHKEYTNTINTILPKIGNNNTTNNQYNVQLFLNEHCKDALNITDFIHSLKLNINDLMEMGKIGYVNGMSRIFVNALQNMDIRERPIHCTDIKREIVYIKDDNKWEKDEENKEKLKKTIRNVETKNLRMIPKWQEENPDSSNIESKKCDEFMELSINALGASTDEEKIKNEKRIMKNILKEVILEK